MSVTDPPRAAGHVISEATADQAAQWLTLLMAGAPSGDDRLRWQQWRAADPDNERAWQHIEAVARGSRGSMAAPPIGRCRG